MENEINGSLDDNQKRSFFKRIFYNFKAVIIYFISLVILFVGFSFNRTIAIIIFIVFFLSFLVYILYWLVYGIRKFKNSKINHILEKNDLVVSSNGGMIKKEHNLRDFLIGFFSPVLISLLFLNFALSLFLSGGLLIGFLVVRKKYYALGSFVYGFVFLPIASLLLWIGMPYFLMTFGNHWTSVDMSNLENNIKLGNTAYCEGLSEKERMENKYDIYFLPKSACYYNMAQLKNDAEICNKMPIIEEEKSGWNNKTSKLRKKCFSQLEDVQAIKNGSEPYGDLQIITKDFIHDSGVSL